MTTKQAVLASYLISVGWELHISSDRKPVLCKSTGGNSSRMETVEIDADTVIELHQLGMIQKRADIRLESQTHSVYRMPLP